MFESAAPHRRYPYFDVVVGLEWSNDPESCAGVVMILVWHHVPDRSKVMTQTKRDTLVLQTGGFGVGLTTPRSKNKLIVTKVE
jgi:hypothetical protein